MKKVWIEPGCISCGSCESICPKVFKVNSVAEVLKDADLEKNSECIIEAAEICPVNVIKIEKN